MKAVYTLYQNTPCIYGRVLYEQDVISIYTYRNLLNRGGLILKQRGGNGRRALIEFGSMRSDIKQKCIELFGDPVAKSDFRLIDVLKPDRAAADFFSLFRKPDGSSLDPEEQLRYRTDAEIFNAVQDRKGYFTAYRGSTGHRISLGEFFDKIKIAIDELPKAYQTNHRDKHPRTIRRRFNSYLKEGYGVLIHGNVGQATFQKRTPVIDRLVLSLYCDKKNPYAKTVWEDYNRFLNGQIDVVDTQTGALFDRKDFMDENEELIYLSEGTIWNIVREPEYQPVIAKYRMGQLEYISTVRPSHDRSAPEHSLSKISTDDRDLPRKMHNGKRVKAYYVYDVLSGAVIGASYSKTKDAELFLNCMRDMFRNLDRIGCGIPLQIEVEHHLVNAFKDDLMKAGNIFPFVRWANPGNPQEKYAETAHRNKKYGFEKRYQEGIGRFYARLQANRTYQDKVFDGENDNYKEKTFDFERIINDDMWVIEKYNNTPVARFGGKTRLEVLKENLNPDLVDVNRAMLAKYIGVKRETSIRRNQHVTAFYKKWWLNDMQGILANLKPNQYEVMAYHIPEDDKLYLYQDGHYVGEAFDMGQYNTANAEWTEKDKEIYQNQAKYVAAFDAFVKEGREQVSKIEIIENEDFKIDEYVPTADFKLEEEETEIEENTFTNLLADYDPDDVIKRARENL